MAQHLQFSFGGTEFACGISKVDRARLYGSIDTEVLDEEGRKCELATLAGDGKTLIPAGGTALASISPDGSWRVKEELTPVDLNGNPIASVQSTFKVTTELTEKATYEEFLSHNIRLLYLLETVTGKIPDALMEELKGGTIYKFQFSYRGGLEADAAFLLAGEDGTPWMMVGKRTDISFIGFEQVAAAVQNEEDANEDEDDGLMDFGV